MQPKKRFDVHFSVPLWWPSLPSNWRAWLPSRGNVLFTLLVVGGLLWATSAGALPFRAPTLASDSTTTISYQGRLADSSGNPVTTSGVGMQFRLYNTDTGGNPLWEESHTAVPVEDGLFHVLLGSTNPIPVSLLANNSTLWLGITVGSDSEMRPREQIASVPYAMIASTVNGNRILTGYYYFPSGATGWREQRINFPQCYSAPPTVLVTLYGAADPIEVERWENAGVHSVDTTGFTLKAYAKDVYIGTGYFWLAIGR